MNNQLAAINARVIRGHEKTWILDEEHDAANVAAMRDVITATLAVHAVQPVRPVMDDDDVVRENEALRAKNAGLQADAEALCDEIDQLREHLGDCADCLDALAGEMSPAKAAATRSVTSRSRALLLADAEALNDEIDQLRKANAGLLAGQDALNDEIAFLHAKA
jgi:cell division protein FtsB